jgi:endonuclease/exonuclease/phosphatase family metal-dependent hydrolase
MGDLNEANASTGWLAELADIASPAPADGPTFPADDPRHRIDWIFSNFGNWVDSETPDTGEQSDHLPVVADLDF